MSEDRRKAGSIVDGAVFLPWGLVFDIYCGMGVMHSIRSDKGAHPSFNFLLLGSPHLFLLFFGAIFELGLKFGGKIFEGEFHADRKALERGFRYSLGPVEVKSIDCSGPAI